MQVRREPMFECRGRRDSLQRSRWRRGPNRGRSGRQPLAWGRPPPTTTRAPTTTTALRSWLHDIDIAADTMKNLKKKIKSIVSPAPGRGSTSGAPSSPLLSSTTAQLASLAVSQPASVAIGPLSTYSRFCIPTWLTKLFAATTQPSTSTTEDVVDGTVLTVSQSGPVSIEPSSAYCCSSI
jgi:hypothetical protein